MKRLYLAQPFLFAVHPVLFLYTHNLGKVQGVTVLAPLAAVLLFALLLFGVSRAVVREGRKAAVIASIFIVLTFIYGPVADLTLGHRFGEPPMPLEFVLAPALLLFGLCLATVVAESRGDLRGVVGALNLAAIFLVVSAAAPLAAGVIPGAPVAARGATGTAPAFPQPSAEELRVPPVTPAARAARPDIYYIILDRYPGPEATELTLDWDNHEFLNWLRDRGFVVVPKSRANYARTSLSLASSLNMVYLTDLVKRMGPTSGDETPLYEMLQDNEVQRFLRAQGYTYFHTGSWWDPTRTNPHADHDLGQRFSRLSQFSLMLLDTTLPRPFLAASRLVPDPHTRHRDNTLYQLAQLRNVPPLPGPKFVFAHLLLPHPPWVFGAHGEPISADEQVGDPWGHLMAQTQYANSRVEELVQNILEHSARPPVILLQSDEGADLPTTKRVRGGGGKVKLSARERLHFRILNAYYLPGPKGPAVWPTITPVNSFRVVLNRYFGTHLRRLPDESWHFESKRWLYDQTNVTEAVR